VESGGGTGEAAVGSGVAEHRNIRFDILVHGQDIAVPLGRRPVASKGLPSEVDSDRRPAAPAELRIS
jgi:hypothetical protein